MLVNLTETGNITSEHAWQGSSSQEAQLASREHSEVTAMRGLSYQGKAQQGQQDGDCVRLSLLVQVTQVHSGSSSAEPAALQSTASKGALPPLSAGDAAAQHGVPPDLPSGFFEAPEDAASSESPIPLPAGFFEAPGQLIRSVQGFTY